MNGKWFCLLGIVVSTVVAGAQHRWLTAGDRNLVTDGMVTEFPLPNPGSGPTTIALAQDGTLWFTESAGNRIGRMAPDGTNLKEYSLPNPEQFAADHRARGGRQHVVFRAHRQSHGPHHAGRNDHRVPDPDAEQHAAGNCARR